MKVKKLISATLAVALVVSSFAACGGGDKTPANSDSGEQVVLRMASDAPLEHISSVLNQEAIAEVLEKTEGRVKIDYYPASQLGGYDTVYEELVRGTIDLAQITIPDALDPRLGVPYMPYVCKGYEDAKKVYAADSYLSQKMIEYTAEQNVKFLGFCLEGFIGIAAMKEPTDKLTPGAPKGVKARVWAAPSARYPMEDLGYTCITIPYPEIVTSAQTGVIDAWIGHIPNAAYTYAGEIIKYYYVNYMLPEATSFVMSQKILDKLSPEDQEIVVSVFQNKSMESIDRAEDNERIYIEKLKADYGVDVYEYSAEEVEQFATFIREKTWPRLEPIYGKDFIEGMQESLK